MPKFIPRHTPGDLDEFTRGYLECVEWLTPEDVDEEGVVISPAPHERLKGFEPSFLAECIEDCRDFQASNAAYLRLYCEKLGRTMRDAGHDFWLTRNRHGAGFWDRGDDPCLRHLTDVSNAHGGVDLVVENDLLGRL